jgi:radical SAM protein with 4Fe4S-binding SPASM domain
MKIVYDGIMTEKIEDVLEEKRLKAKRFSERSICSGNKSFLFILPDGNVTICEELYWHKQFFLGNIIKQGIKEIWDSERALAQHYFPQSLIPSDSACSSCESYEECRWGKGVCYRNIMKGYGEDKWYYPDNNCPKASNEIYELMV